MACCARPLAGWRLCASYPKGQIFAVGLLCALLSPPTVERAWAHAFPASSTPGNGVTVSAPPPEVVIRFTEGVEIEFSMIEVKDSRGETVSVGTVRRLAPDTLGTEVKALSPGTYSVRWQVLSVDTHITEGVFRFTVTSQAK